MSNPDFGYSSPNTKDRVTFAWQELFCDGLTARWVLLNKVCPNKIDYRLSVVAIAHRFKRCFFVWTESEIL